MGLGNDALNYKPASLRWPLLAPFILYVAALIAVVEIVGRTFPSSNDIPLRDNLWDENVSYPTALFTAPLVNLRAPSPIATPSPKPGKRTPLTPSRRLLRAAENATGDGAPPAQESGRVTEWSYHNMPDSGSRTRDPLAGPANITELQQAEIVLADKTGRPVQFAARLAHPPASFLNNSQASNQTWNSPLLRPRRQDPSEYAQYSGPTQIVQPLINIFSDHDGVAYEGSSWIYYTAGDISDPNMAEACWATCNGPAIIFHHRYCWEQWVWYAALEQEARKSNPSLAWKVVEEAYSGGSICVPPTEKKPAGSAGADDSGAPLAKAPLAVTVLTLTDSKGTPTATATRYEANAGPVLTTLTLRDSAGLPTATITARLSLKTALRTLTDANGAPTATITFSLPVSTHTLRDERGIPTATVTLAPAPGPTTLTLTNPAGIPTATITVDSEQGVPEYGPTRPQPTTPPKVPGPQPSEQLHLITPFEYALASFLPVLLTTPLCILSQIIHSDIRTVLPFRTMTHPGGVPSRDSLTMPLDGIPGLVTGIRLLVNYGDAAAVLSDMVALLSAVIAALSSEAVGIGLYGDCKADSFRGCFMGIAVFTAPNRALEGLLCGLLVVVLGLGAVLARWRTGIPVGSKGVRSLEVTGEFLGDCGTREVLRGAMMRGEEVMREAVVERRLDGWRFALGWHPGREEDKEYGIISIRDGVKISEKGVAGCAGGQRACFGTRLLRQPTTSWTSLSGLVLLCGLLGLILYYETTQGHTPFEEFMLTQNFGARVLFTTLGLVVSLFWDGYFSRMSMMEVYRRLSRGTQPTDDAARISPPVVAYTGIVGAFARREWFVAAVAVNTIVANLTPILLSAIPFSPSQTWAAHLVCAWMAVAFLGLMILMLLYGAVFVRHPDLVMDPCTLAGRIYYGLDSDMLDGIRRFAHEKREKNGFDLDAGRYIPGKTLVCLGSPRTNWEVPTNRYGGPRMSRRSGDGKEDMV